MEEGQVTGTVTLMPSVICHFGRCFWLRLTLKHVDFEETKLSSNVRVDSTQSDEASIEEKV